MPGLDVDLIADLRLEYARDLYCRMWCCGAFAEFHCTHLNSSAPELGQACGADAIVTDLLGDSKEAGSQTGSHATAAYGSQPRRHPPPVVLYLVNQGKDNPSEAGHV